MRIKNYFKIQFKYFKVENVKKNNMNSKNTETKGDIPVKIGTAP